MDTKKISSQILEMKEKAEDLRDKAENIKHSIMGKEKVIKVDHLNFKG